MASVSAPAKHRKAGSSVSGRPVIPAIPLPHVKRQAAAAANRSANAKANRPATPVAPEKTATKKPEAKVEDASGKAPAPTGGASSKPLAEQSASRSNAKPAKVQPEPASDKPQNTTLDTPERTESEDPSPPEEHSQNVAAENSTDLARPDTAPEHTNGVSGTAEFESSKLQAPLQAKTIYLTRVATDGSVLDEPSKADSTSAPPNQQPALGSGPSTRRQSTVESETPAPANPDGRYRLQQSHLGNNNVHFGAFDESNLSSPGPPPSGGFGPPPGFPPPASQPRFAPHAGNGVPPPQTTPGGPDMTQGATFDPYGRPMMAFAPIDVNHAVPNGLDPSTPQSFHGSQSSVHQDEALAYQQQLSGVSLNGLSPDGIPPQSFQNHIPRPLSHPPPMLHHGSPMGLGYNSNQALGLATFIQQAWLNGQYVDTVLEVRDRRGLASRFPAHHIVLAQSPVLSKLLMEQGGTPLPFCSTPHPPMTLFVNTDNKWFWVESLKMVVNALYGFYPNPNPQGPLNDMDAQFLIGPSSRCLGISLSYAAGGHVLGINQVVTRGAELATRHLEPRTIDTALAFALDEYLDKGTHEHFKYGEGSKILLNAIVGFVAGSLSPTFHLDVSSTSESVEYSRLPYDSASTPKPRTASVKSSAAGHLSKGSNAQKQLNIQFGDLSVSSQGQDEGDAFTSMLSRILLNLPFSSLKLLAEYGPESTAEARLRAAQMAVTEREARRLRALDAVLSGASPNADAAREILQSPEPKQYSPWSILGWHEELTHSAEGPTLARQWQPLRLSTKPAAAEYP